MHASAVISNASSEVLTSQILKIDDSHGNILLNDGTLWSLKIEEGIATMDKVILDHVIDVSNGYTQSLALKEDGTVWAWGGNWYGERGDDQYAIPGNGEIPDSRAEPLQISGLSDVTAISAATRFSMALKSDGTVWTWGSNNMGGLGDGRRTISNLDEGKFLTDINGNKYESGKDRFTPGKVESLTDVIAIDNFGQGGVALKKDGTVWAWSEFMGKLDPYQIPELNDIAIIQDTFATTKSGEVWGWGLNDRGQYGNGIRAEDTSSRINPVPVRLNGLDQFQQIEVGMTHVLGLKNGELYSWGGNEKGSLGNGKSTVREFNGLTWEITSDHDRLFPTILDNISEVENIWINNLTFGGFALTKDGQLWLWGRNNFYPQTIKFLSGPFAEVEKTTSKTDNSTPTQLEYKTVNVLIDGVKQSYDQSAIIKGGSTLVPLRGIFEQLGAEVLWDNATRSVTAKKGDMIIELTVDQKTAYINGKVTELSVEAQIIGGSTMVPLRFVSEALGADVAWDALTFTASITSVENGIVKK